MSLLDCKWTWTFFRVNYKTRSSVTHARWFVTCCMCTITSLKHPFFVLWTIFCGPYIWVNLPLSFPLISVQHLIPWATTSSFEISDATLSWLWSYVTSCTSSVRIGRQCSSPVTCTTGVPQFHLGTTSLRRSHFSHCWHNPPSQNHQ